VKRQVHKRKEDMRKPRLRRPCQRTGRLGGKNRHLGDLEKQDGKPATKSNSGPEVKKIYKQPWERDKKLSFDPDKKRKKKKKKKRKRKQRGGRST